jgi:glycosyltransferase involved in cell wall biosynthesis
MNLWQCPQYFRLGQASDVMFLSIQPWTDKFRKWFPRIPVLHLPVGSNIPLLGLDKSEAKQRLGIAPEAFVIGLFGQAHISRMFDWVAAAYHRVRAEIPNAVLLYVGPSRAVVEAAMVAEGSEGMLIGDGPFPAEEVSRRLAAMDMILNPYLDGVSTRRGVFMAGIQHGVPTVGTHGIHSDRMLVEQNNDAFILTPATDKEAFLQAVVRVAKDSALREKIGGAGQRYYHEQFAWDRVADRLLSVLSPGNAPAAKGIPVASVEAKS